MVTSRQDAFEILCYLIASARTQLDEAAEYAPLRLLTAAGRLAAAMEPHVEAGDRALLREVVAGISETSLAAADPAAYTQGVDALCVTVAQHLRAEIDPREQGGR
ncbi:DUF6092 family protein [Streptomyces sp. NPDC046197]|uniref:DUF6092 family protein n=1 Tax=Streptomyces sp. NPDC046197 TaxID=3154337 RepID=UPI0033CEE11A